MSAPADTCTSTTTTETTAIDENDASAAAAESPDAVTADPHSLMMEACRTGNCDDIRRLIRQDDMTCLGSPAIVSYQLEEEGGVSPLMVAAQAGHVEACRLLLDAGAPWNALDVMGRCAGNYATDAEQWNVVNLLVDFGTKAELILGASMRLMRRQREGHNDNDEEESDRYLQGNVRYNPSRTALLDDSNDAVMMEWERPLMEAHASLLTRNGRQGLRVLNVGFGMGIIDTALQQYSPGLHVIIEAHPDVWQQLQEWKRSREEGGNGGTIRCLFGKWQDVIPKLVAEGMMVDAIFFDTYGEHWSDMEDFHTIMVNLLAKPDGIYSFFNGLAPDNLFFHGVACECVKLRLNRLGLDVEFASCEMEGKTSEGDAKTWQGVRRKYWHGRNTYYLPIATWKTSNSETPATATSSTAATAMDEDEATSVHPRDLGELDVLQKEERELKKWKADEREG